jgi:GTP-binding protein
MAVKSQAARRPDMDLGLNYFRQPCQFIAGAATIESLPPIGLPEIAFIGRSNVGKSSLVNALVGQKALARTSQNPGATQQLNFFNIGDGLTFVDMPGYGYAKVSKQQKGVWDQLIRHYLMGRTSLQRTFVLIDARRGIMETDNAFMDMLDETAVSYQIVLTKADTVKAKELSSVLQSTQKAIKSHAAAHPEILTTSATSKDGIETLQEAILPFVHR